MSAARVALGLVELHLPDVESLKGKRHVLKGLKEKVRARFQVSVAEVDHQDLWQRAALGVAVVSGESHQVTEMLDSVRRLVEGTFGAELIDWQEQHV